MNYDYLQCLIVLLLVVYDIVLFLAVVIT